MDAAYIRPFISAVQNVFSMMVQLQITIQDPVIKTESHATFDVSGIIGLSGDVVGNVVLSFPTDSAERIVTLFTGMEMTSDHEDFADAIGELVNMVTGNAKADFEDREVSISCPSVVIGHDHTIGRPKEIPCVAIPCQSDCGDFVIEVCIQDRSASSSSASDANAAAA